MRKTVIKKMMNSQNENANGGTTAGGTSTHEPQDSDYEEYIVHKEGNEEIHITGKAKKQLTWSLMQSSNLEKSTMNFLKNGGGTTFGSPGGRSGLQEDNTYMQTLGGEPLTTKGSGVGDDI